LRAGLGGAAGHDSAEPGNIGIEIQAIAAPVIVEIHIHGRDIDAAQRQDVACLGVHLGRSGGQGQHEHKGGGKSKAGLGQGQGLRA
jgi:hypothetical protein